MALTENAAALDLNSTSKLNAGGNLTVSSKSETPTDISNNVDTVGDGLTAIGANFLQQTNSSDIKVAGKLSGNNISVQSENLLTTYKITSHIETLNLDDSPKDGEENKPPGSFTAFNTNIAAADNSSHIEIADNAELAAKGNLAITSNINLDDPQIGALIVTSTDNSGGESLSINPAVSTAQIKNDSAITATYAKLQGSAVAINSNVNVDNARLKKLKQDVQSLYSDVKNVLGDSEQLQNFFDVKTLADVGNNDIGESAELVSLLHSKIDSPEKFFGTADTNANKLLNAKSIDVKAVTDGAINSLSIAGGLTTSQDNNNSSESLGDNAAQSAGNGSKISSAMDNFQKLFHV